MEKTASLALGNDVSPAPVVKATRRSPRSKVTQVSVGNEQAVDCGRLLSTQSVFTSRFTHDGGPQPGYDTGVSILDGPNAGRRLKLRPEGPTSRESGLVFRGKIVATGVTRV
jgi:hypothetical protein